MGQNLKVRHLTGEFTRSANTTAYANQKVASDGTLLSLQETEASGQVISTIPLVRGASYQIKTVKVTKSTSGTTNATMDLHIFTSGITAFADNANYTMLYANKQIKVGKTALTFYTGDTNSGSAEAVNTDVDLVFKAAAQTLSVVPVFTAAYSPGNAEKFFVDIEIIEIDQ